MKDITEIREWLIAVQEEYDDRLTAHDAFRVELRKGERELGRLQDELERSTRILIQEAKEKI